MPWRKNAVLNMLLFVSFALFATLATDRAVAVLGASVIVTGVFELAPPIARVRVCHTQDLGNNAPGAALGVAGGWVWGAFARR